MTEQEYNNRLKELSAQRRAIEAEMKNLRSGFIYCGKAHFELCHDSTKHHGLYRLQLKTRYVDGAPVLSKSKYGAVKSAAIMYSKTPEGIAEAIPEVIKDLEEMREHILAGDRGFFHDE